MPTRQYKGDPFQIRWERRVRVEFEELVKAYDPLLSLNNAILKLIFFAIMNNWLPGYERVERVIPKHMGEGRGLDIVKKLIDKSKPT